MKLYVVTEQILHSSRVVFISRCKRKVEKIIREKYKLDDEQLKYLFEWKEYFLLMGDITIRIEEIETDKYQELQF